MTNLAFATHSRLAIIPWQWFILLAITTILVVGLRMLNVYSDFASKG